MAKPSQQKIRSANNPEGFVFQNAVTDLVERSEYDASEARGIRAVLKASKNAIKQIGNFDFTLYIEARMRVEKSQNGANLRRKMVSIFYRHRGTA